MFKNLIQVDGIIVDSRQIDKFIQDFYSNLYTLNYSDSSCHYFFRQIRDYGKTIDVIFKKYMEEQLKI